MTTAPTTTRPAGITIAQSVTVSYGGRIIGYAARADARQAFSLTTDNGLDLLAGFTDLDDAIAHLVEYHLTETALIGAR